MEKFLLHGGDPTLKDKNGFTCLHVAAREGKLEIAKLLISKGVDPNIRDGYGFSAAYWARQNKHTKIGELLPNPLKISKEEFFDHI